MKHEGASWRWIRDWEILALVGGRDPDASKFNRATGFRQPGAAFKPVVYATALNGYRAVDHLLDALLLFPTVGSPETTAYDGEVTLMDALGKR